MIFALFVSHEILGVVSEIDQHCYRYPAVRAVSEPLGTSTGQSRYASAPYLHVKRTEYLPRDNCLKDFLTYIVEYTYRQRQTQDRLISLREQRQQANVRLAGIAVQ